MPPGADKKEIRRRFRKLAATEHPDKRPDDPKATERFARITQAYEELMAEPEPWEPEYQDYGGASIPLDEAEANFRAAEAARGDGPIPSRPRARTGGTDGNAGDFVLLGSVLVVAAAAIFSSLNAVYCTATNDWWCDDALLPDLDVLLPDPPPVTEYKPD